MPSGPPQRSLLRRYEAGITPSGPQRRSSPQRTMLRHCVAYLRHSEGSFTAMKRLVFQASLNTRDGFFFPSPRFCCAPSSPVLLVCIFFSDFEPSVTTMVPKKTIPAKRHRSGSTSREAPPPPDDLHRFISREVERLYHKSLCIRSFVPERGFPTSNAFFNFTIQSRGWQTLCAPPTPGVAPVVREFYYNLPFRVDTTVFVQGKWVDFRARAINQFYQLQEDDSEEYQALFMATDFEGLMHKLTWGQGVWRHHSSTGEFTTFPMTVLTPVAKV